LLFYPDYNSIHQKTHTACFRADTFVLKLQKPKNMIKTLTGFKRAIIGVPVFFLLFAGSSLAQTYSIGSVTMILTDSTRSNRQVPVEVRYPADVAGANVPVAGPQLKKFPVVVFGHGAMTSWDNYEYISTVLVVKGFIVAFPTTEAGISPDHEAFARDMSFVVNEFARMRYDATSMFFKKYNNKSCVMGHGMGGGAATLAAMYNPGITTLVTLAASETSPSAIAAAANIEMPTLIFTGTEDCVAPAATNQLPMYNNLASLCKAYLWINDATHCHFAQDALTCTSTEVLCIGAPTTVLETNFISTWIISSWVRYFMKYNNNALPRFDWKLAQKQDNFDYYYTCVLNAPREALSIEDETEFMGLDMKLYPNPVANGGSLNLEIPAEQTETVNLLITGMLGQVVVNRQVELLEGTLNSVSIPVNNLERGHYLVVLTSSEERVTRALVIE
jgi:alpha-beta hydrolase superfamily lysophospholipase